MNQQIMFWFPKIWFNQYVENFEDSIDADESTIYRKGGFDLIRLAGFENISLLVSPMTSNVL